MLLTVVAVVVAIMIPMVLFTFISMIRLVHEMKSVEGYARIKLAEIEALQQSVNVKERSP